MTRRAKLPRKIALMTQSYFKASSEMDIRFPLSLRDVKDLLNGYASTSSVKTVQF